MLSIPSGLIRFVEVVITRIMMFLIFYLALEFARMFISASASTHPYMAMWGAILFETALLILFNISFGKESVGRDISTLMFYGVLIHIAYLPFFFYGINLAALHNNAHKTINALIELRLLYIGGKELLRLISPVGYFKKSLLAQWYFNSYINSLTISIFAFCAVPLFTLIYLINTDKMRLTGIAIILVSFYLAIENSKRRDANNSAVIANDEAKAGMMTEEEFTIIDLRNTIKMLAAALVVLAVFFPTTIDHYQKLFFDMGYASGFSDAKSKAPPKKETDFETAVKCVMEANTRMPQPPGKGCLDRK